MLFESIGTKHGRKKGQALRLLHLASGLELWSGNKLVQQAKELAHDGWLDNILRNGEKYQTDYILAFIMSYTDSSISLVSRETPALPKDISSYEEIRERYRE